MDLSLRTLFSSLSTKEKESTHDRVVGIDVGSSSVKVVELELTDQAPVLRTYGELQLGPYAKKEIGQVSQLDQRQTIEVVIDILREAGVQARTGVFTLPLSASFIAVVSVNLAKGETVETRLPVLARKYIPVPVNEVSLDWILLPEAEKTDPQPPEAVLIAVQNDALNRAKELLQGIDMASQPLELEIFSVIRSTITADCSTYAVIDIGAQFTRCYVVHLGMLHRIHRVTRGGADITASIVKKSERTFTEAEEFKRFTTPDNPEFSIIKESTAEILEDPLHECKRLVQQFELKFDMPLQKIIFTGGVSATPELATYISDVFGREVEIAAPFSKVAYPQFMQDTLAALGPSFTTSLGAALRLLE